MDHELDCLEHYIAEAQAKLAERCRLRELNLHENIDYTNDDLDGLEKLDSSIKKNSAFVKRLKVFSESQKGQILDEVGKLNLTKFISEVAASLIEAKLKLSDIPSVIEICTKLNRSYKDFSRQLLDQYVKYFPNVKRKPNDNATGLLQYINSHLNQCGSASGGPSSPQSCLVKAAASRVSNLESIPSTSPAKLRVDLRLLAELIVTGILPLKDGFPVLMNLLCYLMVHEKNVHQNANAILTFCKGCGDEFMGLVPRHIEELAAKYKRKLPTGDFITAKRQTLIRSCMHEYFLSLSKYVQELHKQLDDLIARNEKACKIKGELSKESKDLVEAKRSEFHKINNILVQLSELLGETAPVLQDPVASSVDDSSSNNLDVKAIATVDESLENDGSLWDDDGTRSFYEDLLDLKTLFPSLQVKAPASRKTDNPSAKDCEAHTSSAANDQSSRDGGSPQTLEQDKGSNEALNKSNVSSSSSESLDDIGSARSSCLQMAKSVADRVQPDQYFAKLSDCVNRDMIDNSAIDFIRFFNTKFGRKKLIKTLYNVHRTRLDLLPFFARLTATIHPYVPSVGNELASLLRNEFRNLFKKKDQINIESKVKNVRFIGELVKFDLVPKQDALNCLRSLLSDFTHHHIEMTCNMLEVCGRLLYKSPQSHHQLRLILEQMMRKKMLLSVDSKYVTMIENAYYFTNPPKVTKRVIEEPPVHMYVKYLLYDFLNRSTIDKVLKKIKLIDWNDKSLAKFLINCMIEAHNLKFYNIRYLAALLSALNKGHQWISIAVVDGVIEDILLMMEINDIHFNQRRIPMVRYFGELYNYRLSDSSLVFKILYSFITYGVYYPNPNQNLTQMPMSHLDPPDNLFRIKLICDLLDTCGQYMSSSQEKRKLDCYLLFFQRYYWCKKHIYLMHPYCMVKSGNQFPASTEYLYNDTIKNLRPRFRMVTSYQEAIQASQTFIQSLQRDQQA